MIKSVKYIWLKLMLVLIFMTALAGCGAGKNDDEAKNGGNTGETVAVTLVDNENDKEEEMNELETVIDEIHAESETESEMVTENMIEAAVTISPTTVKVDKSTEYNEMVAYLKSTGKPYKYVTNDAEYIAFAESCEGKDFYILYLKDTYGKVVSADGLPSLSTFDDTTEGKDNLQKTYYGYAQRKWLVSDIVASENSDGLLKKVYKIRTEKDIDAAITEMRDYGNLGDEIKVIFIWKDDFSSAIRNKMFYQDYFKDTLYKKAGFESKAVATKKVFFGYYIQYMKKNDN